MGNGHRQARLGGLLLALPLVGLVGCSGSLEASDGTDASAQPDAGIDSPSSGQDATDASWEAPAHDAADEGLIEDATPPDAAVDAGADVAPSPQLVEIVVEPGSVVCMECSHMQFEATGFFGDGDFAQVITQEASWTSDAPTIAVVEGPGWVVGLSEGTSTIRAELQGIVGSAKLTVPNTEHFSQLSVTPSALTLPVGGSAQLEAATTGWTGCDAGIQTWSVTENASWTSSDESVATVDLGFVVAHSTGVATIRALANSWMGTAEVTVVPVDAGAD